MSAKCALLENSVTADPKDYAATVQISCRVDGNDDQPVGEWGDIVEATVQE